MEWVSRQSKTYLVPVLIPRRGCGKSDWSGFWGNLEGYRLFSWKGELWLGIHGRKATEGWGALWAKLALRVRSLSARCERPYLPAHTVATYLHAVVMYCLCITVNYLKMAITTINRWQCLIRGCNCVCQEWYYYVSFNRIWDINSSPLDSSPPLFQVPSESPSSQFNFSLTSVWGWTSLFQEDGYLLYSGHSRTHPHSEL